MTGFRDDAEEADVIPIALAGVVFAIGLLAMR